MNTIRTRAVVLSFLFLTAASCQQQMAKQPYYRPLEPSDFFGDERSARAPVEGTVPRGLLRVEQPLHTGLVSASRKSAQLASLVGLGSGPTTAAGMLAVSSLGDYVREFPLRITESVLRRGQERFNIYCVVCHDRSGNGNGIVVQRGYTRPPSLITDRSRGFERRGVHLMLRDVPAGYYFEVVSKGFGAMPDYASQVPAADRWAIIAYVRALQLSQHARLAELPPGERAAIEKYLEK